MNKFFLSCGFCLIMQATITAQNLFENGKSTEIYIGQSEKSVVHTALNMLQKDIQTVFDAQLTLASAPGDEVEIVAGTPDNPEFMRFLRKHKIDIFSIQGQWEAFMIRRLGDSQLIVAGSDARGLAYGLLELSREAGVSPWEWWADVHPEKQSSLALSDIKERTCSPSVQFRGIFLNDEDWGLNPWSTKTFEPDAAPVLPITKKFKGQIGPKTYAKIFELLLRLRANTLWPAMHEVTVPFYFIDGNREMAERYGIVISTSHCEPLMRNSATEWDLAGEGDYNFLSNRQAVIDYWAERLKDLGHSENIFTMGMRGKHDGRMIGVHNTMEYKEALQDVLQVQDSLLRRYINSQSEEIPQQFIPYKEVLDVYHAGLNVPEHITLVWPDDNFGYIRHFPDSVESRRKGGNGVYFHTSYWGEPHDFLWLGIVQPALMYQQMKLAYDRNMRKIWILNVGDIKPSEYLTELFLDMAWDINLAGLDTSNSVVCSHLKHWLISTFGQKAGEQLLPVMNEFYLLSHIRKPEFMGNNRTYAKDREAITDLPWSAQYIHERLSCFSSIVGKVKEIQTIIPYNRMDAYFELIRYPIEASNEMNKKILYAQLARHTPADSARLWHKSDAAYDSIAALTHIYNNTIANGKWNNIMSFCPRELPVFGEVPHSTETTYMPEPEKYISIWNGTEYSHASGEYIILDGFGHEGKAIYLKKGASVEYSFTGHETDSVTVEIRLVPTHAVIDGKLRFAISIGDAEPQVFDYETAEYSEEWKTNVLRAQAIKTATFPVASDEGLIKIYAIDEGIVVDQICIK